MVTDGDRSSICNRNPEWLQSIPNWSWRSSNGCKLKVFFGGNFNFLFSTTKHDVNIFPESPYLSGYGDQSSSGLNGDFAKAKITLPGNVTRTPNACCTMKRRDWSTGILPEEANILSSKRHLIERGTEK